MVLKRIITKKMIEVYQMGTPIPRRANELKGTGAGPITTYKLSPEEMAKIIGKPIGRNETPPINLPVRRNNQSKEEPDYMRDKEGPACGLTKQALIEAVAAGETLSSIERAWSMKYNTIHNWVKKWRLKGITAEKAQVLLEEQKKAGATEVEKAQEEVAATATAELAPSAEAYPQDWVTQLRADSDHLRAEVEELHSLRAHENRSSLEVQAKLQQTIDSLSERLAEAVESLLLTEEEPEAPTTAAISDPVHHPAHYNAGGIECIDAIESAITGLTGGHAFNTGSAIKYLWRWAQKNGVEDLEKARWYIDRIVTELQAGSGKVVAFERKVRDAT